MSAEEPGPDGKEWAKTEAGYAHVEAMPRADGHIGSSPIWYGWALREAFVAGAEWQEKRRQTENAATVATWAQGSDWKLPGGKWTLYDKGHDDFVIRSEGWGLVAMVPCSSRTLKHWHEGQHLHATLLVHAPDMLAQLETLAAGLQWNIEAHPEVMTGADDEALADTLELIKKAKGQS